MIPTLRLGIDRKSNQTCNWFLYSNSCSSLMHGSWEEQCKNRLRLHGYYFYPYPYRLWTCYLGFSNPVFIFFVHQGSSFTTSFTLLLNVAKHHVFTPLTNALYIDQLLYQVHHVFLLTLPLDGFKQVLWNVIKVCYEVQEFIFTAMLHLPPWRTFHPSSDTTVKIGTSKSVVLSRKHRFNTFYSTFT